LTQPARDPASGQPYLLCPFCGHRSVGFAQIPKPCPRCLEKWLMEQGLPVMRYHRVPDNICPYCFATLADSAKPVRERCPQCPKELLR
jgi:hypothetical protein